MNYNELFSQVVSRSKASAIRELLKVIARPDIISFAGGLPAPELFPTHEIDGIMHHVLTNPKTGFAVRHHRRANGFAYGTGKIIKRNRKY